MSSIVVFVNHPREFQVLNIMFQSYGFETVALPLKTESFVQVVQYKPSYIVIEVAKDYKSVLDFINNMQSNIQIKRIPILAYGDFTDLSITTKFNNISNCTYLHRPLKTVEILEIIEPKKQITLVKHRKEEQQYADEVEYISKVMDPSTSAIERIDIMSKTIGELLAFPFTIAKVLNVTESATTGAKDLARAIEIDPVVVSSVLKVANSALFSRKGSRIITIKDAIVRLGFTETKNIAISLSVMNLFSDEERSIGFSREEFWFHSLATAIIAGKLAQRAHFPKPELAFICGLLHDFGIILLDEFFPTFLQSTLQSTMQKGISFLDESKARWKMTHNDVVMRLFDAWNLPEEVKYVIASFNTFTTYENTANPVLTQLIQIVGVSQTIAKSLNLGRECDEVVARIPDEIMKQIKIPIELNTSFFDRVISEINMFAEYLKLKRTFTFSRTPDNPQRKILLYNPAKEIYNPFVYNLYSIESQIIEISTIAPDTTYGDDYNLVLIIVSGSIDIKELSPLLKIEQREESPEEEDTKAATSEEVVWVNDTDRVVRYTPVALMGKGANPEIKLPENVTYFPNETDLRIFSYAIETVIMGNNFSFQDLFKEEASSEETSHKAEPQEKKPEKQEQNNTLSFSTRVIDKRIIVIELKDKVLQKMLPNFRNILALALKKCKLVVVDIGQTTQIDDNFLSLVELIKMKITKSQIQLHVCSIGNKPESISQQRQIPLLHFDDDKQFLEYIDKRNSNNIA